MNVEPKTIKREDLYNKIWQTPATKLAKVLGISDVALAKICRKLNVPKPGLGHWRLVQLGRKTEQPPLPALETGMASEATINPEPHRTKKAASIKNESVNKPGVLACQPVPVADTLHGAHALVSKTRHLLEREKPDEKGIVHAPWRLRVLSVSVSKAQIGRALRIMDALFKALERRGASFVKTDDPEMQFMNLKLGDERIGIGISEVVDKTEREPKDQKEKESWMWKYEKWQYRPTGKLEFHIFESEPKGARRNWRDCTHYQLEEKLGEIVEWLFITAEGVKKTRLEWEEARRRRDEEHRRREERERRRQIEERHRGQLVDQSRQWTIAEDLRAFIQACEKKFVQVGQELPADSGEMLWLNWAREHADRIDPLKGEFLETELSRFDVGRKIVNDPDQMSEE